jgi:hypothetical protein
MAGPISVQVVDSPAGIDLFHAAGLAAQGGTTWRPPARYELRQIFDPRSPIMRENRVRAFVTMQGGKPVGRIAAIVNGAYAAKYGPGTGHFGYLEGRDDDAVFDALIAAASDWLRTEGMNRVQGPFSLTINHESGLLVHGFDQPHYVRTNYAPPSYARHLERLGFVKEIDLLAYACSPAESDYPERVRALLARSPIGSELSTTGLTYRNWKAGSHQVNALFNDAWAENWGSVPVSDAEGDFIASLSLAVVKPSWIRTAYHRGEAVALVGHLPDMNEATPGNGELFPFGWTSLLGGIHLRGVTRSRLAMIGIARRFRGTRVGSLAISLLMAEAIETARGAGIGEVEISWMLEHNQAILNLVASLPARHTRTFRIFTRPL